MTESFDDLPVPDSLIQPLFEKNKKKVENIAENKKRDATGRWYENRQMVEDFLCLIQRQMIYSSHMYSHENRGGHDTMISAFLYVSIV